MLVSAEQLKKETNLADDLRSKIKKAIQTEEKPIPDIEKPVIESITKGNILGADVNLEKRKEMISAKGLEPAEFAYERAIGKNDSLYSNFTELIELTKRKIGRIVIKSGSKTTGYATGFMVSPELLLTNWHVFKNDSDAEESEVQFFYEYDVHGHPMQPVIFNLDNTKFYNNEELDYCFVAVKPVDISGKISLSSIGYLYLDRSLGKIGDENVEKLNIIHHPQGDYKQISIRENTFVGIEATKIFYETDTAQGSSGSPVFNDQWQVVGLHHKSIAKMTPDGLQYLDLDDKIIPEVNGKIDLSKIVWLKNEGIRISVILNHIDEKFPGDILLGKISDPPPAEDLSITVAAGGKLMENYQNKNIKELNNLNSNTMTNSAEQIININVPVNALDGRRSIDIRLSSETNITAENTIHSDALLKQDRTSGLLEEIAKADKETAVDFSKCKGYDPDFLGVKIPLPLPKKKLEKQIAMLKDKTNELKYFKYSVIFNSVAKMPAISAINVEGDPGKRLDNSKRSDDWLRDVRIDVECQLTDKFYSGSNFDKGHMSRFEDANWDTTEKDALRNGIYTCFYTNACPQVVKLNRAGGLWGKLEKAVLEKGVKKEKGKLARISVFNGPIFNDDKDRVFKGVTIPMDYYKVILWLDDDKKLKTTAFILSQELLVSKIKFDESMRVDEEALDIDKDVVFKNYQCSIKKLGSLTNIDFKHIEKYDTFKSKPGGEESMIIEDESAIDV